MKLLLDTDIGSDIDDAVCLAYLLAQPQCDLLGITTVTGLPQERAKLASALCLAAGKRLPIFPGIAAPLLGNQRQPHCPQSQMLTRWRHESHFPEAQAIEFLRTTIRTHPGQVTLLAIGPLTNIATLFTVDPEIPAMLKQLVLMAGLFAHRKSGVVPVEWNALCDPHAAAIVYRATVATHRSIGLDVTLQVQMPAAAVRERFTHGLLRPVLDFAEVWLAERPTITFHDPLAAATLFDQQICDFERGTVEVELTSARLAGYTHFAPGAGPHEVAQTVDPPRFFHHFFATLESAASPPAHNAA